MLSSLSPKDQDTYFPTSQLPSPRHFRHTETNHSPTAIITFTHPHSSPDPRYAIHLFTIIGFLQRFTLTSLVSYVMHSAMSALLPMTHTPTHKPLSCPSFIGNMRTICDLANLSSHFCVYITHIYFALRSPSNRFIFSYRICTVCS